MFRSMLRNVFKQESYTKYFSAAEPIGPLPGSWTDCYPVLASDPETTYFIKTHDGPEDSARAIYIVRHGLAAIRSYKHFFADFKGWNYSLEEIILGETFFCSWGWHLDAWNPLERPNTLLLRYEGLVERPEEQLQRVAAFIGLARQAGWVNEFDKLHAGNPKLFRQGPGVPPEAGFTDAQQELFWHCTATG